MIYEKPQIQIIVFTPEDIITLSVDNDSNETINVGGGQPNPWSWS